LTWSSGVSQADKKNLPHFSGWVEKWVKGWKWGVEVERLVIVDAILENLSQAHTNA